jgi:tRNA nucleotidyltransferase (CCA-adding enzyme)
MKIYLVGGAVRDELLGVQPVDRDWVVVGASRDDMIEAGYSLKDERFGVFLHPETSDEYALARREKKSGDGHRGFEIQVGPDVTLSDDLVRRDLTVNAIARAQDGSIVDPYGGTSDLKARVLRPVSAAFEDDPLRLWRAAQFRARLDSLGFEFSDQTLVRLRIMAQADSESLLSRERVWLESQKAIRAGAATAYLSALHQMDCLSDVPESPPGEFESLLDTDAAHGETSGETCFVALLAHLSARFGAGEALRRKLGVPASLAVLIKIATDLLKAQDLQTAAAEVLLRTLEKHDALRRHDRFHSVLRAVESVDDPRHRKNAASLRVALCKARGVDLSSLSAAAPDGRSRSNMARNLRLAAIEAP